MARVRTQFPVGSMSGKVCKNDEIYTKTRRIDEASFAVALKNPCTNEPPSAKQARAQSDLVAARTATDAAMQDSAQLAAYTKAFKAQRRYKTLRGYIFHKLYTQTGD